jgi:hypothetical protein
MLEMISEHLKFGDQLREAELQIEICIQLSRDVESRRVFKTGQRQSERSLATLKFYQ